MTNLTFVGDTFISSPLQRTKALDAVVNVLQEGNLVFANLEQVLTKMEPPAYPTEKTFVVYSDPSITSELHNLGFSIVTVANNHTMDWGYGGLFDTMKALTSANIPYVGAGKDLSSAREYRILESNGTRVAYIGCSSQLPRGSAAGQFRPGLNPVHVEIQWAVMTGQLDESPLFNPPIVSTVLAKDLEDLCNTVNNAKKEADIVVLACHGGATWMEGQADYQVELAHAVIDAGCDIFIGHNSHKLQAVEIYSSKLIFYDLGNFIFHKLDPTYANPYLSFRSHYDMSEAYSRQSPDTVIPRVTIDNGQITSCQLTCIRGNSLGEPELASKDASIAIIDRLTSLSKPYGTKIVRNDSKANIILE